MEALAWISLVIAFACAVIIAADEVRHPQHMWMMSLVWPITALHFSLFGLWAYFALGGKAHFCDLLVHDAERNGHRIFHLLPDEPLPRLNHFLVRWGLKEAM